MAMVFLFNLPEDLVTIVRLKAPATLEQALEIVLEEENFHQQYKLRHKNENKCMGNKPNKFIPRLNSFNRAIPQLPQNLWHPRNPNYGQSSSHHGPSQFNRSVTKNQWNRPNNNANYYQRSVNLRQNNNYQPSPNRNNNNYNNNQRSRHNMAPI